MDTTHYKVAESRPDQSIIHYKGLDPCWNWLGPASDKGYGIAYDSTSKRGVGAHRVSWETHHGKIPHRAHVCHKCDNPSCVNPSHLFLGDAQINSSDKSAKGRCHKYKLSAADIRRIFELRENGTRVKDIAAEFNMTTSAVYPILSKRCRTILTAGFKTPSKPTYTFLDDIHDLQKEGVLNKQIATRLGVPYWRVSLILRGRANQKPKVPKKVKPKVVRVSRPCHRILSEEDIVEIRRARGLGVSRVVIAQFYGIRPALVASIAARKVWQHVS